MRPKLEINLTKVRLFLEKEQTTRFKGAYETADAAMATVKKTDWRYNLDKKEYKKKANWVHDQKVNAKKHAQEQAKAHQISMDLALKELGYASFEDFKRANAHLAGEIDETLSLATTNARKMGRQWTKDMQKTDYYDDPEGTGAANTRNQRLMNDYAHAKQMQFVEMEQIAAKELIVTKMLGDKRNKDQLKEIEAANDWRKDVCH